MSTEHYQAQEPGSIDYHLAGPDDQATLNWFNAVASYGAHSGMIVEQTHVDRLMALPRVAAYSAGFGRPGDVGFVATINEQPVGAAWGRIYKRSSQDPLVGYPFEITIGVTKTQRGLGIGGTLLAKLVEGAANIGMDFVALGVSVNNPGARRLYERHGWQPLPEAPLVEGEYIMMIRDTDAP